MRSFVPRLIVVAAVFGKWVLDHFSAGEKRERPLHIWDDLALVRRVHLVVVGCVTCHIRSIGKASIP